MAHLPVGERCEHLVVVIKDDLTKQSMPRQHGAVWREVVVVIKGEMAGDVGRCRAMSGDVGRCRAMSGDVGRWHT